MKPTIQDFQQLLSNDSVLCTKAITDINMSDKFKENEVYPPIRVSIETSGKYNDSDRVVYLIIYSGMTKCKFTEYGITAEQDLFELMKKCFVPISEVISIYKKNTKTN